MVCYDSPHCLIQRILVIGFDHTKSCITKVAASFLFDGKWLVQWYLLYLIGMLAECLVKHEVYDLPHSFFLIFRYAFWICLFPSIPKMLAELHRVTVYFYWYAGTECRHLWRLLACHHSVTHPGHVSGRNLAFVHARFPGHGLGTFHGGSETCATIEFHEIALADLTFVPGIQCQYYAILLGHVL